MRNPRAGKLAGTRARAEALRARAAHQVPQQEQAADEEHVEPPAVTNYYLQPTLQGPVEFKVGATVYGIPEGCRTALHRGTHGRWMGAVEEPGGKVHLLDEERGEASLHEGNIGAVRLLLSSASVRRLAARAPRSPRMHEPTFRGGGAQVVTFGAVWWPLDRGDRFVLVPGNSRAAFVLTAADGVLHVLQEHRGRVVEVEMPEQLRRQAAARYFAAGVETHGSAPGAFASLPPGPVHK